jgi:sigma-B regulation protein RsbU (phosphoserine phosphatase)
MLKAPIPENDAQRIAAVRALKVLDTPPEERFDRVTRLATRMFGVPIAYVSLVDTDRQWFKSACGLSGPKQTGRDISFCGHAIHGDDAMVVPDTLLDPRFADNPLVVNEPHMRFYAGQPLSGANGHKVGTFCIADRKPRQLNETDLAALRELAGIIERELGLTDFIRLQNDLIVAQDRAAEAERERNEALETLVESQKHLACELEDAAEYVRSLLPKPMRGDITADWCLHPCSQLGGDSLGYHWLDRESLAIYLLDVCGHGVGSALLSISVVNAIRSDALPKTNFREPAQVITALNHAFPMESQDNKFFTIWYGVYHRPSRRLTYAAAGHPPALLISGRNAGAAEPRRLWTENFFVGLDPDAKIHSETVEVHDFSRLFVFSDGAFEVPRREGGMMHMDDLFAYLVEGTANGRDLLATTLEHAKSVAGSQTLPDDFSLLRIEF